MRKTLEAHYTKLENETLEALARSNLTARDFRVMLSILRLTNGYHLTDNRVSIKYLQQLTTITPENLYRTLKRLRQYQMIVQNADSMVAINGPALWSTPPKRQRPSDSANLALPETTNCQLSTIPDSADLAVKRCQLSTAISGNINTAPDIPKNPPKENLLNKTYKENIEANASFKGKRAKKTTGDPRVSEVMALVEKERGWVSPCHAGEARAVKWMLTHGYSVEDITACWRGMGTDVFWQSHPLYMMSVEKKIGQWKRGGENGGNPQHGGAGRRAAVPGPGDPVWREQALRLGQSWDPEPGGDDRGGPGGPPGPTGEGQRPAGGDKGDEVIHPGAAPGGDRPP